jgi:hypothetical protein
MRVYSKVTKCVVYLGWIDDAGRFHIAGTGFFVMVPYSETRGFLHVVTAQHVVRRILEKSDNVYARINRHGDGHIIGVVHRDRWKYHPDATRFVDVAVCTCHIPEDAAADISAVLLPEEFANEATIASEHIGAGEEVFIAGYFSYFPGQRKNIPIVRVGNIAAMPDELLETKNRVKMAGYLIEARSIGGLSGSPVFVHMPALRVIDGEVTQNTGKIHYLLGLMHGHYDLKETSLADAAGEDGAEMDATNPERLNVGIGIVVPAKDIEETLMQDELVEARKRATAQERADDGPVSLDSVELETDETQITGDDILRNMLNMPPDPKVRAVKKASPKRRRKG